MSLARKLIVASGAERGGIPAELIRLRILLISAAVAAAGRRLLLGSRHRPAHHPALELIAESSVLPGLDEGDCPV
jgi:hypothetical protein